MDYTIVGIGEILWDILPNGRMLGGAPANFAYHAKALGARSYVVSSVGNDELGEDVLRKFKTLSLNPAFINIDPNHPTGTAAVKINRDGLVKYSIRENVAWDYIENRPKLAALAEMLDAVSFGTLAQRNEESRVVIRSFIKKTRPEALRVFDVNLRPPFYNEEIIKTSLNLANVLKINDEELKVVAEMLHINGDELTLLEKISSDYNLKMIALTRGEKGSLLFTKNGHSFNSVYPTQVIDTVGAGDSFTAALVIGLLEGVDIDRINDYASRIASFVCSKQGATPKFPQRFAL